MWVASQTTPVPTPLWGPGSVGQVQINFHNDLANEDTADGPTSHLGAPLGVTLTVYDSPSDASAGYQKMYTNFLGYLPPAECMPAGCTATVQIALNPSATQQFCLPQLYGAVACGWLDGDVVAYSPIARANIYSNGSVNGALQIALNELQAIAPTGI
jgi:hypothetical protein